MPPDDEAQNETSRSSPSRREYAFALITAPLFTAVNSIGLSYIYTYYAGDIEHQVLPVVTYYLIQALSALLPYLPLAVSLRSVYIRGAKKSIPLFIISAVGLMMPYISPPLLELLARRRIEYEKAISDISGWPAVRSARICRFAAYRSADRKARRTCGGQSEKAREAHKSKRGTGAATPR